jgi:hypothetical protein
MADVRGQLEKATAEMHITGVYADPDWFRKAKAALRYMGAEHQVLLKERAALKKQLQSQDSVSFERHFMAAAKAVLDDAMYSSLLSEARTRMANGVDHAS